ncbi:DUF7573 domain-containing protein [Halorubrum tebenquichense]|uniref:DUF7573 domain-containing protein n=1 Tax=Halorubrum tebenquichense DSM 14210 TaxID=1227485 RepID=M0DH27_9EURY|nr:hypothetical protein [Halorubrum tebenquichense]ELZ34780.1 hypothetical protein C472_12912 [Halorubrum tebenquichense DSM 14210]
MSEDRSLDDFAPDGAVDDSDETTDADAPDADAPDADAPDADAPDAAPATATSTWHADGAACDRCGERVERRWRDGEAFVCADCAAW